MDILEITSKGLIGFFTVYTSILFYRKFIHVDVHECSVCEYAYKSPKGKIKTICPHCGTSKIEKRSDKEKRRQASS